MHEFTKEQTFHLRDECVSLIVKAVETLRQQCHLSDVQSTDVVAPILTKLTADSIDRALDFAIHLMKDEMDKEIRQ